jgi:hypothetical protein
MDSVFETFARASQKESDRAKIEAELSDNTGESVRTGLRVKGMRASKKAALQTAHIARG